MFDTIVHNDKIYLKIIKQFKELLRSNNLKPGDKLPPERELAKILGVSRPSLKQALNVLEAQNIIECRHGDGNYILPFGHNIFNPITMDFYLQQGNMDHILEFRCLIEIYVTKLATFNRTPKEELKPLYAVVELMTNNQPLEERMTLNNRFHYELIKLSKNPLIIAVYGSILELIGKHIFTTNGENFKDEHQKIINAILSGDTNFAAQTMGEHFERKFPKASSFVHI